MHVLLTCKNEVYQIKNEEARVFTRFLPYKPMGIFPDAQGQLTPQSLVRSGRISNSSEMLWMSSLPASMKKIRSKNRGVVSGRKFNSSKLSCMSSIPARMRMIDSKMKELECSQDFSHYNSYGDFSDAQGQLTLQSMVDSGTTSNLSEILWLSSLAVSMKKIRSKMKALVFSQHFPTITLWELSVAIYTRVLIRSGPKPNAFFPPTQ